eukprot:365129-Chlamydomonas_euryale.AAC.13
MHGRHEGRVGGFLVGQVAGLAHRDSLKALVVADVPHFDCLVTCKADDLVVTVTHNDLANVEGTK